MDELIQAMSIPELEKFKEQYSDNVSITKIIDGYIVTKTQELAKVKAQEDFGKAIDKMVSKLPHPDDVHNIYMAWQTVEVEDTSAEPEEVEVDGVKELRYPKHNVSKWVVTLNKGFQVAKSGSARITTSKRAITVKHIEPDDTLKVVGNYRSASEACKGLKLPIGADSAVRVLQREGYLTQPYEGTDFIDVS